MTSPPAPPPEAPPLRRAVAAPAPGGVPGRPPTRAASRIAAPDLARRYALDRTRGRLVVAACGFAALFLAVAGKLTLATVISPTLPRQREAVRIPTGEPTAARAAITDRNGEMLAVSLPVTALYARPPEVLDPVQAAQRLRTVLPELDQERLVARLTQRNVPGTERAVQFAYIARGLTPRQQQAVNNLGLPGLYFEEAERRFYPQGRAGVHVIGGVDVDGDGIAGLERSFQTRLRDGAQGPLRTSLDIRVQLALRDAVQGQITAFNGIGGAGVVLDVNTAEVIALVSLPDYDAGDPTSASHCDPQLNRTTNICERFNRVTAGVYEPGSTFKLLTAAMALEAGTVNIWGGYDASRPIQVGRFTIEDYRGKGRWLALPEILAYSSNIATAHMASAVGPQRHREFMGRMGMLARLQVELPEVVRPLAPGPNAWRDINTMTIGFGHGIAVTPLHVAMGAATLANGGILRQPTLLAQPAGVEREGTRVISERTSDTMRRLMRLVVTDGSGKSADVPGYFVGGKTGTAQKTDERGHYLENRRIAAFVGAFPMNAPRYAVYVMVDEPRPNAQSHGFATAGWVAAPAAHAVVSRIAPILGLVPETDRIPQIQQAVSIPMQPARPPRGAAPGPARPGPAAAAPPAATPPTATPRAPALPRPVEAPSIRRTDAAPPLGSEQGLMRFVALGPPAR